ncbi:MAG: hypothetical protein HYV16_08690 [Gammaproteobacteria bacterium]|nr:hypothetical protein [Gammaproteobacteria bacterium]
MFVPVVLIPALPARHAQTGAVLVVGLIILAVLTVIGVTALSGGALQLRMASNSQQSAIVFGAAESAVSAMVNLGNTGKDFSVVGHPASEARSRNADGDQDTLDNTDAIIHCLNMNRGTVSTPIDPDGSVVCGDTDFLNDDNADGVADSQARGRARLFYRGTAGQCPGISLNQTTSTLACHFFHMEGVGWLDDDSDGVPEPLSGESTTTVDAWTRFPGPKI